jgi:hypothetical protein
MATGALIPIFSNGIDLDSGLPNAAGLVYFYVAGTTQPQAVYKNAQLTVAWGNPLTLDSSGRAPGGVYFQPKSYKVRVHDASDVLLWEQDEWQDFGQVQGTAVQANRAKSQVFDLDNGAGTIIDDVIMRLSRAVTLTAARVVYVDAQTGTVAAGTVQLGTTQGGDELVSAKNYENGKAVGAVTNLTLASAAVAANQAIHVRHVGVAATQAGKAFVEIEYT